MVSYPKADGKVSAALAPELTVEPHQDLIVYNGCSHHAIPIKLYGEQVSWRPDLSSPFRVFPATIY